MIRKPRDNWFYVSKSEVNGYIVLLIVIILSIILPILIRWLTPARQVFDDRDLQLLDSLVRSLDGASQDPHRSAYFKFNPNTVSKDSLVVLGVSDRLAQTILNYRSKGGSFQNKEDLLKIYHMDSGLYTNLYPYIDLPGERERHANIQLPMNINKVSMSELSHVGGVGTTLGRRIINFRNKLGGFVSEGQFEEVYGIDNKTVSNLRDKTFIDRRFVPEKVNLNTASRAQMEEHPYISAVLALDIEKFRSLNGSIEDTVQLKNFKLVDEQLFRKLYPYIEF